MKICKLDIHVQSPNLEKSFLILGKQASELKKYFDQASAKIEENFNIYEFAQVATTAMRLTDSMNDIGRQLNDISILPDGTMRIPNPIQLNHIVQLLTPNIIHYKLPISKMVEHKWYGISELGNTTLEEWKRISGIELDKMPTIGYVFKCISVPKQKEGEAVVYIANPPCMDVHELSKQLNITRIFNVFKLIGQNKNKSDDYKIEEISIIEGQIV